MLRNNCFFALSSVISHHEVAEFIKGIDYVWLYANLIRILACRNQAFQKKSHFQLSCNKWCRKLWKFLYIFIVHPSLLFQKLKANLISYDMRSAFSAFRSWLRQCSMLAIFTETVKIQKMLNFCFTWKWKWMVNFKCSAPKKACFIIIAALWNPVIFSFSELS